ncbi:D-ribose pyranase [Luteococcus sp. OSA5]|uniref:D-ribose pyranase n=1 Tax=Luteococcus sp. OSA5 TaxID=3401630 RepID=UPI003B43C308
MKKHGVLNPALSARLARLGHLDTVVVADCGLPVPSEIPVVDLALVFGVPRFTEALDAVLGELVVERAWIAEEAVGQAPQEWVAQRIDEVHTISHDELKQRIASAAFVLRTGETTSYANVVLQCGVPF